MSGEALSGSSGFGIDPEVVQTIAREVAEASLAGVQVAVVVGGGNFFRGAQHEGKGLDRASADYMGMLGTVMNGMALKEAIERLGTPARLMSAIDIPSIAETFIRKRALRHFEKGRIVILAAGTGNPFFTTDTCAALRAIELNAASLALKCGNSLKIAWLSPPMLQKGGIRQICSNISVLPARGADRMMTGSGISASSAASPRPAVSWVAIGLRSGANFFL